MSVRHVKFQEELLLMFKDYFFIKTSYRLRQHVIEATYHTKNTKFLHIFKKCIFNLNSFLITLRKCKFRSPLEFCNLRVFHVRKYWAEEIFHSETFGCWCWPKGLKMIFTYDGIKSHWFNVIVDKWKQSLLRTRPDSQDSELLLCQYLRHWRQ